MSKQTKAEKPKKDYKLKEKTNGVFTLFVVASIGFMAYMVILGTEDVVSKVLTAPALVWAVIQLVIRFSK
jgi:hypothetical protein